VQQHVRRDFFASEARDREGLAGEAARELRGCGEAEAGERGALLHAAQRRDACVWAEARHRLELAADAARVLHLQELRVHDELGVLRRREESALRRRRRREELAIDVGDDDSSSLTALEEPPAKAARRHPPPARRSPSPRHRPFLLVGALGGAALAAARAALRVDEEDAEAAPQTLAAPGGPPPPKRLRVAVERDAVERPGTPYPGAGWRHRRAPSFPRILSAQGRRAAPSAVDALAGRLAAATLDEQLQEQHDELAEQRSHTTAFGPESRGMKLKAVGPFDYGMTYVRPGEDAGLNGGRVCTWNLLPRSASPEDLPAHCRHIIEEVRAASLHVTHCYVGKSSVFRWPRARRGDISPPRERARRSFAVRAPETWATDSFTSRLADHLDHGDLLVIVHALPRGDPSLGHPYYTSSHMRGQHCYYCAGPASGTRCSARRRWRGTSRRTPASSSATP